MATQELLLPSAACLSASMRDIGYSLETAVADIIDNSITAKASDIHIISDMMSSSPVFLIIDNGIGMTKPELLASMRHGSKNPKEVRSVGDLGRFGLGLKTASFSQCKQLTVISSQNGMRVGATWDLDLIDKEDAWVINILDEDDINSFPCLDILGQTGTLVAWQKLDRFLESESHVKRDEIIDEKLVELSKHLSLVFHRFISGDINPKRKLSIKINGHEVDAFDPFCLQNKQTQPLPEEKIRVGSKTVVVQPYILPHHSNLSAKEQDHYKDRSDFLSNQGAYVYRNGRLMVWGDWFRIIPKGESSKLARVRIDFTSDCDEDWTIDIKKSKATPPLQIRERLKQLIPKISFRSIEVSRGRGRKLYAEITARVWVRFSGHDGIRYQLNSKHPLVESLEANLGEGQRENLHLLLESIASSLPLEYIYSDFATSPSEVKIKPESNFNPWGKLVSLKALLFSGVDFNESNFRDIVKSTELFVDHEDVVEKFIKGENE